MVKARGVRGDERSRARCGGKLWRSSVRVPKSWQSCAAPKSLGLKLLQPQHRPQHPSSTRRGLGSLPAALHGAWKALSLRRY